MKKLETNHQIRLADFQTLYSDGSIGHLIQENNVKNKDRFKEWYKDEKEMSIEPYVIGRKTILLPKNVRFKSGFENILIMYNTGKQYDNEGLELWQDDCHIEISKI